MLYDLTKSLIASGIGAAIFTKDKAKEFIADWVNNGHLSKEEGEQLLATWLERLDTDRTALKQRIEEEVMKILDTSVLVSKKQYQELQQRVDELEQRILNLEQQQEE